MQLIVDADAAATNGASRPHGKLQQELPVEESEEQRLRREARRLHNKLSAGERIPKIWEATLLLKVLGGERSCRTRCCWC